MSKPTEQVSILGFQFQAWYLGLFGGMLLRPHHHSCHSTVGNSDMTSTSLALAGLLLIFILASCYMSHRKHKKIAIKVANELAEKRKNTPVIWTGDDYAVVTDSEQDRSRHGIAVHNIGDDAQLPPYAFPEGVNVRDLPELPVYTQHRNTVRQPEPIHPKSW